LKRKVQKREKTHIEKIFREEVGREMTAKERRALRPNSKTIRKPK
jgi:hypothetical protein